MVTGKFAPSKKWHVDTILRVMMLAGQYIPENVISDTVALVSQSTEVQAYAVRRFFSALKKEPSKKPLVYVAVWCLGEFGDLLTVADGEDYVLGEGEVVDLLIRVLNHPVADDLTREYCLSALAKLSARYSAAQQSSILKVFAKYQVSIDLEVQARACEFASLINKTPNQLQRVMDRVPPLVLHGDDMGEDQYLDDEGDNDPLADRPVRNKREVTVAAAVSTPAKQEALIDLEGLLGGATAAPSPSPAAPAAAGGSGGALDLLSVLMPGTGGGAAPVQTAPAPSGGGGLDALLDLSPGMGGGGGGAGLAAAPVAQVVTAPPQPIIVFDKNSVKIMMQFAPQPDGVLFVQLVSTNASKEEVKSFTLLMAVPTYVKLQMAAPSGNVIPPNGAGQVTQQVKIENSEKPKPTLVKLKVDFSTISGGKFSEVVNVASFPSHL
jgi:AP-1 complex subunit gamma-1